MVADKNYYDLATISNGESSDDPMQALAYLPEIVTLKTGDIIFTGTSAGVGVVEGKYFRDGQIPTTSIEGFGSLNMALCKRGKVTDVVIYADQGNACASERYRKQLRDDDLLCSMSRKGECLDNAVAKSFFGSLKNEMVHHEDYRIRLHARQSSFLGTSTYFIAGIDAMLF